MYESKKNKYFNYLILSPWIPIAQNELFEETEVKKYFFFLYRNCFCYVIMRLCHLT